MNEKERNDINRITGLKIFMIRLPYGVKRIREDFRTKAAFIAVTITELLLLSSLGRISNSICRDVQMLSGIFRVVMSMLSLVIYIGVLFAIITPVISILHTKAFKKIALVNHVQEAPQLLSTKKHNEYTVYEYYTEGIPLAAFVDKKELIEAALNISVISIYQGKNKHRILVKAMSGDKQLPTMLIWNDAYLQSEDNKIVFGKNLSGLKVIDLDVSPHIQCGGSTGSGKTVLLKCVLYQLKRNKAEVYLCDFKGFIDFPFCEEEGFHCIGSKESLNDTLKDLIHEMNDRKELFRSVGCHNISEFHKQFTDEVCKRIILASDEVAFAFQKKGLRGEEKALVDEIEAGMSLIAQQGRFAGIHLWLSTQRGDADTIPPQIRSNLTTRICGRASDILSRVTVDNSLASEIPIEYKGRFVDDSEEFFQAFYFEEMRK